MLLTNQLHPLQGCNLCLYTYEVRYSGLSLVSLPDLCLPQKNPTSTMAIVLIGSTGSGKSSLGNFLIDPSEEHLFEKPVFSVAKANMPETQFVLPVSFKYKKTDFTLIDTPGLNESDVRDLRHMIQIVDCLQKVESIVACVLVVKFNSKIDAQYRSTVQYYRKLLPSLFERNVIIVMTNFATDDRSVMLREKKGTNVEEIKRNTIREIVENGSLAYEPLLFTIDCLPMSDDEQKLNKSVRSAIFSKLMSQKPFPSKGLMVAKTAVLKSEDNEKTKSYEGEITGYNTRLQQANARATEALEKIQSKDHEITEKEKELHVLKTDLVDKDSSDLTSIDSWSVSEEWKFFQWFSKTFERTTACEIESVDRWTNGHCEWKDYEETKHSVKGKIEGEFMRGIYASLTLQASKRNKYAKEITSLRQQIGELEKHRQSLKEHLNEIRERYKEYTDDIKLLEQFIEEKRVLITALMSDYMTLEEALGRLDKLEKN